MCIVETTQCDGKHTHENRVKHTAPRVHERRAEPLLSRASSRFVLFPIVHDDIWMRYKVAEASIWHAAEIDMSIDKNDWNEKLSDNERRFITYILAFFASSDMIVVNNLLDRFISEVEYPELKIWYSYQSFIEAVHSETYSLMIDTFVSPHTKDEVFRSIQTVPCIRKKAEWAIKWMSGDDDYVERLIGFAVVEGICFCSSFCAIYWLMKRNLMTNSLGKSNQFIARDERMHAEMATHLYKNHIVNKLPESRVHEIVREGVDLEKEFATESLPVDMLGMNSAQMSDYIEYVADGILRELGVTPLYYTACPYDFMENLQLEPRENFFEQTVSVYSKSGVLDTPGERQFVLTADF